MTIKEKIDQDIKIAMLGGDKVLVTTLRGLKSAILNSEIAQGLRDKGLPEDQVISLLQKESKKRLESAALYKQGDNNEMADKEIAENQVIANYLPEQLGEDEIKKIVVQKADQMKIDDIKQMGQLIGAVKSAAGGSADGAMIAKLVKEHLS